MTLDHAEFFVSLQSRPRSGMRSAFAVVGCGVAMGAAPAAASEPVLIEPRQLTSDAAFARAGEAYFSHDLRWIVFQATPWATPGAMAPSGGREPASAHYEMYAGELDWGGEVGGSTPRGLLQVIRLSPGGPSGGGAGGLTGIGSANTCGWFHPTREGRVLWGSTLVPPEADAERAGYQREGGDYRWAFPESMDIVVDRIDRMVPLLDSTSRVPVIGEIVREHEPRPRALFERPGYDAEASWSPCGRYVLYTHADPASGGVAVGGAPLMPSDPNLWLFDTRTRTHAPLVMAPGYDGGPFFHPRFDPATGETRICYRSDRRGDNHLQLFVAELAFGPDGASVRRELAVTDDLHVNWAPYWAPDGEHLLYTTSREGHFNYEIFAVDAGDDASADERRPFRITDAPGFDGMSVVSDDGRWMMWTSQRGRDRTSQVWIAGFDGGAFASLAGRAMPRGRD